MGPGGGGCVSGGMRGRGHTRQGACVAGEACMAGGLCVAGGHAWHAHQPHPMDRMTDACKNITLLQASFAGGNYRKNASFLIWGSLAPRRRRAIFFGQTFPKNYLKMKKKLD